MRTPLLIIEMRQPTNVISTIVAGLGSFACSDIENFFMTFYLSVCASRIGSYETGATGDDLTVTSNIHEYI